MRSAEMLPTARLSNGTLQVLMRRVARAFPKGDPRLSELTQCRFQRKAAKRCGSHQSESSQHAACTKEYLSELNDRCRRCSTSAATKEP